MAEAYGGNAFSIGHSNHTLERLLELLSSSEIAALADVRSQPYSRYSPHFDSAPLRAAVEAADMRYVFLGEELGGRPTDERLYDEVSRVRYDELAETALFRAGIDRLIELSATQRVAMMCSEEDPAVCHRYLLVARVLEDRGVRVLHIRGDGRIQTGAEIEEDAARARGEAGQLTLFAAQEQAPWRSLRSVSPRKAPPSFLER